MTNSNISKESVMTQKTMTSRDIAELCGKQHAHVLRDIRDLKSQVEANPNLDRLKISKSYYTDAQGKSREQYLLDKEATLLLVTGYDAIARLKLIRRWDELEQAQRGQTDVFTGRVETKPVKPKPISYKDLSLQLLQEKCGWLEEKIGLLEQAAQPKRRNFTDAEKLHILTRVSQGEKPKAVAVELGRSPESIETFLRAVRKGGAQ